MTVEAFVVLQKGVGLCLATLVMAYPLVVAPMTAPTLATFRPSVHVSFSLLLQGFPLQAEHR